MAVITLHTQYMHFTCLEPMKTKQHKEDLIAGW